MARPRLYSVEKQLAAMELLEQEVPVPEIARRLDVKPGVVRHWRDRGGKDAAVERVVRKVALKAAGGVLPPAEDPGEGSHRPGTRPGALSNMLASLAMGTFEDWQLMRGLVRQAMALPEKDRPSLGQLIKALGECVRTGAPLMRALVDAGVQPIPAEDSDNPDPTTQGYATVLGMALLAHPDESTPVEADE